MIRSTSLPLVLWAFSPAFLNSLKALRISLWSFYFRADSHLNLRIRETKVMIRWSTSLFYRTRSIAIEALLAPCQQDALPEAFAGQD